MARRVIFCLSRDSKKLPRSIPANAHTFGCFKKMFERELIKVLHWFLCYRAKTVSVGATLASPYAVGNIGGTQGGGRGGTVNNRRPRSSLDRLGPGTGDYFGLCTKCNMKIIGDGTGCTAMGRLYHVDCFTCTACHCLLQGKPFYALDGKVRHKSLLEEIWSCFLSREKILPKIQNNAD